MKHKGTGEVMPSRGPVATLPAGDAVVTVEWVKDVDGMVLARCVYPDGFDRHHQIASEDDVNGLMQAVTRQMAGRYGAGLILKEAPAKLADGLTLTFGG